MAESLTSLASTHLSLASVVVGSNPTAGNMYFALGRFSNTLPQVLKRHLKKTHTNFALSRQKLIRNHQQLDETALITHYVYQTKQGNKKCPKVTVFELSQ